MLEVLTKEAKSSEDFCRELNEAEVRTTLRTLKSGKVHGESGIVPKILKALEKKLTTLLTKVY